MTEITAIPKGPLWPRPRPARYVIDPVAFFVALIGGPLLITAATFWLFIPVAALAFGGPMYLVLGTPTLLWLLRRYPPDTDTIVLAAIIANVFDAGVIALWATLQSGPDAFGLAIMYGGMGTLFAGVWAMSFAWLYRSLRRPMYRTPLHPLSL